MEAADGHPSRAALVLERAESEGCCLHERVWVTHSDLLLAQMGAKDEVWCMDVSVLDCFSLSSVALSFRTGGPTPVRTEVSPCE